MPKINFIERVDTSLQRLIYRKGINQFQLDLKKYLFSACTISLSTVIIYNLVTIHEDLGLLREYGYAHMSLNCIFAFIFYYIKGRVQITGFIYLFLTTLLTIVFALLCGGTLYSGGIIFVGTTVIVLSIILGNYLWSSILFIQFLFSTVFIIFFQSIIVPEPQLSDYINQKMFNINFLVLSTFLFVFSIYLISLRTRLEKEESERQQNLNKAKTRLYTNITHEFRTPLTIILGLAGSLRKNKTVDFSHKLDLIKSNGYKLLELVEQMLKLSKIEAQSLPAKMIKSDIIGFIAYIIQSFEYQARQKSISFASDIPIKKLIVDFDPDVITTIISNLLSNAIKFTDAGGSIYFSIKLEDDHMVIVVKDNGIGISAEHQEHIYDRFYQVESIHTRQFEGAGIGLSLTKELVKLLGGDIKVKSEIGVGSEFQLNIPIPKVYSDLDDDQIPAFPQNPEYELHRYVSVNSGPKAKNMENEMILIVEDNDDLLFYLESSLSDNYQIEKASNGEQGVKKAIELIPDIIISDVMMPKADGFELCHSIKNDFRTSHIPLILLTAKGDIDSKIEGLETGADDYVVKPFNIEELSAKIRSLLKNRKRLHQRYLIPLEHIQANDSQLAREDRFMKKFRDLVIDHIDDTELHIDLICSELAMSKAQLYRKFKSLTNKTVAEYIRKIRIHKAKSLLEQSDLNITQIAYSVGIGSISRFGKLFKREFGVSPGKFRQSRP